MTTKNSPDPAQAFRELLEATTELREIEQRRVEQIDRRARAVRDLYAAGVTVPALAELTDLSSETIKRLVAPARAPERRQNRWLSTLLLMLAAYTAAHGGERQRELIMDSLDRGDPSGATSETLRRWFASVDRAAGPSR